jgi:hypothetical protein
MPSFLLTIFLVQLAIHLLNTAGAASFSEWVSPGAALPPTRTEIDHIS